jgi:hypothetical protein
VPDSSFMPLPIWIVAIRDPAHAYMLLSNGEPRHRRPRGRHKNHAVGGYAQLHSGPNDVVSSLSDEEMQALRVRGTEVSRVFHARFEDTQKRYGDLLRVTASELMRTGAATLRTTSGDMHGRILRFRNEAAVLEIVYPWGRSQSRCSEATIAQHCVHDFASALAQAPADAMPLTENRFTTKS